MTWEWIIAIDLWATGIAGGAYIAAFSADRFSGGKHKELFKKAVTLGVPLVILGVLLLIIDLGEPFRAWHLYFGFQATSWEVASSHGVMSMRAWPPALNFSAISPMSIGSWTLVGWVLIGIIMMAIWSSKKAKAQESSRDIVPKFLKWLGFLLSILIITYTGVILSVSNRPLWSSSIFLPVLFAISAVTTGIAALLLFLKLKKQKIIYELVRALYIFIILEIVALILFLVSTPTAVLLANPLFWIGAVIIGLFIPLWLAPKVAKEKVERLVPALTICVLLGGFILRAAMIASGQ